MRSPALISASSKAGCHAVLASLSGRYPPLEGRSPTCYSPVRHSVSIATNRVRLACVRHAASVDSEPGSNSHVKRAVLPKKGNSITRSPVDLALALYFVRVSLLRRSLASASALTCFGEIPAAPARMLTLDGRSLLHKPSYEDPRTREHLCACTHYLVFKEPECSASPFGHAESPPSGRFRPF